MVEPGMYKRRADDVIALQIPFFNKMRFDESYKAIQEVIDFLPRECKVERYQQDTIKIIYWKDDEELSLRAKCGDVLIKRVDDETNWGVWPKVQFTKFYEPMTNGSMNGCITW